MFSHSDGICGDDGCWAEREPAEVTAKPDGSICGGPAAERVFSTPDEPRWPSSTSSPPEPERWCSTQIEWNQNRKWHHPPYSLCEYYRRSRKGEWGTDREQTRILWMESALLLCGNLFPHWCVSPPTTTRGLEPEPVSQSWQLIKTSSCLLWLW